MNDIPVRLIEKNHTHESGWVSSSHQAANLNRVHTKWSRTGISESLGLLQHDSGASEKRRAHLLVVRAATTQPYNSLQRVPALQEEAETDRRIQEVLSYPD